ncbi:uncharacterized protein LOC127241933 [Andrographis paniculata]|uniref:uncharacterized protein LOC127241933 n=1 Tax=Andrographis paniculata TaxID=175694 RepID=UPI0021E88A53|nr:uncharacterized protein LOC127241933 [Andrographis paniculata]
MSMQCSDVEEGGGAVESPPPPSSSSSSLRLRSIESTLVIRQLPSHGLSFQLWPAAAALVALLDNPPISISSLFVSTSGRLRLLELGSGTGLVGIAAAALLGADVTVTDLAHVLPNLQFNINANAASLALRGGVVKAAHLPWGDLQRMEDLDLDLEYDVILGSDVVYHDHLYDPLIQTLRFFLLGNGNGNGKRKSGVFLMAHLKRWKKESAFFRKARKFFDVQAVHTDSPVNGSRLGVTVYKFVRKELAIAC